MQDSHCHLDFPEFDADRAELIARARARGVTGWLVPGVHPGLWEAQEALRSEPGVWLAVGLHPWWIPQQGSVGATLAELERRLERLAAVAVGECGLDAKRPGVPLADQLPFFEAQLELARARDLPVILHQVGARTEFLRAIERGGQLRCGGVVHGFSGDASWASALVGRGLYLGFGQSALAARRERLRAVWLEVPLDRVLLETDAPSGRAGHRSVPADLVDIARELGALRGSAADELSRTSDENLAALLGMSQRGELSGPAAEPLL